MLTALSGDALGWLKDVLRNGLLTRLAHRSLRPSLTTRKARPLTSLVDPNELDAKIKLLDNIGTGLLDKLEKCYRVSKKIWEKVSPPVIYTSFPP